MISHSDNTIKDGFARYEHMINLQGKLIRLRDRAEMGELD